MKVEPENCTFHTSQVTHNGSNLISGESKQFLELSSGTISIYFITHESSSILKQQAFTSAYLLNRKGMIMLILVNNRKQYMISYFLLRDAMLARY